MKNKIIIITPNLFFFKDFISFWDFDLSKIWVESSSASWYRNEVGKRKEGERREDTLVVARNGKPEEREKYEEKKEKEEEEGETEEGEEVRKEEDEGEEMEGEEEEGEGDEEMVVDEEMAVDEEMVVDEEGEDIIFVNKVGE